MPITQRHRDIAQPYLETIIELAGLASGITQLALGRGARGYLPKDASLVDAIFRRNLTRAVKRAARRGLIAVARPKHHPPIIRTTEKGRRLLAQRQIARAAVAAPKRWDRKWRIVMFDVPERNRRGRERLRSTLQSLGFILLQRSVWIYPYDCRDLVTLMRTAYGMEHITVRYLVVDELEEDAPLRRRFDV